MNYTVTRADMALINEAFKFTDAKNIPLSFKYGSMITSPCLEDFFEAAIASCNSS